MAIFPAPQKQQPTSFRQPAPSSRMAMNSSQVPMKQLDASRASSGNMGSIPRQVAAPAPSSPAASNAGAPRNSMSAVMPQQNNNAFKLPPTPNASSPAQASRTSLSMPSPGPQAPQMPPQGGFGQGMGGPQGKPVTFDPLTGRPGTGAPGTGNFQYLDQPQGSFQPGMGGSFDRPQVMPPQGGFFDRPDERGGAYRGPSPEDWERIKREQQQPLDPRMQAYYQQDAINQGQRGSTVLPMPPGMPPMQSTASAPGNQMPQMPQPQLDSTRGETAQSGLGEYPSPQPQAPQLLQPQSRGAQQEMPSTNRKAGVQLMGGGNYTPNPRSRGSVLSPTLQNNRQYQQLQELAAKMQTVNPRSMRGIDLMNKIEMLKNQLNMRG